MPIKPTPNRQHPAPADPGGLQVEFSPVDAPMSLFNAADLRFASTLLDRFFGDVEAAIQAIRCVSLLRSAIGLATDPEADIE